MSLARLDGRGIPTGALLLHALIRLGRGSSWVAGCRRFTVAPALCEGKRKRWHGQIGGLELGSNSDSLASWRRPGRLRQRASNRHAEGLE